MLGTNLDPIFLSATFVCDTLAALQLGLYCDFDNSDMGRLWKGREINICVHS